MAHEDENGEGHIEGFDESDHLGAQDIVQLPDDEGNLHDCLILAVIEEDGVQYAMLAAREQWDDDEEEDVEVFFLTYATDEDGIATLGDIDDDATFDRVRTAFGLLAEHTPTEDA